MNYAEEFRAAMRNWTAGVAIASCGDVSNYHGMTVNSFTSVSVDPPMITVTMAKHTRTLEKILDSKRLGISILSMDQQWIAERFSGKDDGTHDRFDGITTFSLSSGVPFIEGALAFFDCLVAHTFEMPNSVLMVASVVAIKLGSEHKALVYTNRMYGKFCDEK